MLAQSLRRVITTGAGLLLLIVLPVPAVAALTAQQQLGKALFNDRSLSHGGNQSCSSCHNPNSAFTDADKSHPTSKGDDPALFGKRNTPTAMYAAYAPPLTFQPGKDGYSGGLFLDGRVETLEQQAKAPFLDAVEMGNSSAAEVVTRLQAGANAAAFKAVFGADAFDDVATAYTNLSKAIAAYERSPELSPFTSKYDYYLDGKVSLSAQEQRGLQIFNNPGLGNCAACHSNTVAPDGTHPLFTDYTYNNIGIPKNYASDFLTDPASANPDGMAFLDAGLGGIDSQDDSNFAGMFKVSTLRNIGETGPYGHNGWFPDLDTIIDYYATRQTKPVCVDATVSALEAEALGCWPEMEFSDTFDFAEIGNLPLTLDDEADLKAFLLTLTDGYQAVPEPASWALMLAGFAMLGAALRRPRERVIGLRQA